MNKRPTMIIPPTVEISTIIDVATPSSSADTEVFFLIFSSKRSLI